MSSTKKAAEPFLIASVTYVDLLFYFVDIKCGEMYKHVLLLLLLLFILVALWNRADHYIFVL